MFVIFILLLISGLDARRQLWGKDGHAVTAYIAQELMSASSVQKAESILGSNYIDSVASWADWIDHQPGYAWSKPLHFINTPDWKCDYIRERDCSDDICAAGAIANFSRQLVTTSGETQKEALMFLIHFVGDIHQPLHVSFASDRGGNNEHGSICLNNGDCETASLHGHWDYTMIEWRVQDFPNEKQFREKQIMRTRRFLNETYKNETAAGLPEWLGWAKHLKSEITPAQMNQYATCYPGQSSNNPLCPGVWANGTSKLACDYAYTDTNGGHIKDGFKLAQDYYERSLPIIAQQIIAGGIRLASLLDYLFANMKN